MRTIKVSPAGAICALFALGLSACGGNKADPGDFEPLDFETFVDGKEDTGYLSNKAAELEARLTSSVYIDMTGQGADAIQAKADSLRTASRWTLQSLTSAQLKYARNPLKSEELDMNLERGEPEVIDVRTDENGVWLDFSTAIESLVKFKDLEEKGLTPADLVGKRVEFLMPAMPDEVYDSGGMACAEDPDGDALAAEDLRADNYFYYFAPAKEGCPLVEGVDLVTATYEIISSLDTPSVYPEYDLLTRDKQITMVALFGQITHGELESNDLGWIAYREFKSTVSRAGFSVTETFADGFGERMEKTYPGDLKVVINFYTPEALQDHRPRAEVNELFMQAIHDNELVYYNGHAFYGSLSVLDDPAAYPQDTYQVIFMDACWSYAYYTKQVFEHKATDADPDGMKYADVVNNTEPGITGSHETAWLLYKNIFQAASELMRGRSTTKYSWNNLIVYMNDSADKRARWYDPEKFHAEIYGVSGVRGNCFDPGGVSRCDSGGESPRTHTYADAVETAIPDNDPGGVSRIIEIPDTFDIADLKLELDVRHTYIGDLKITLSPAGTEVTVHGNEGGGADDIQTTLAVQGFGGQDASGEWQLKIVDSASYDTGRLVGWKLIISEPGGAPDTIQAEASPGLDIPDDDPAGVESTIPVADDAVAGEVEVHVSISHTYVGDLIISLAHAGQAVELQRQEGGSAEDLDKTFTTGAFSGQSTAGDWTLKVSDNAQADVGRLDAWSLTIYPGP